MTARAEGSPPPAISLLRTVAYILGSLLMFVAGGMAVAALVSVIFREWETALSISAASLITSGLGYVTRRLVKRPDTITIKQAFATVGLAWFVFALFGSLPYLLSGAIPDVSDAVFEAASGFTTTGASVINPEELPRGILFWRALTQWLGGGGVIVLGVAVLPLLGTGGMQLARAESSGYQPDRLTPRFRETAKRLWLVYAIVTAAAAVMLALGDMSVFQSVLHSLTTVSTGGFGSQADSIAGFSAYTQWVMTFFMFAGGVSFALHFRAWNRPGAYWRETEFRLYLVICVVAVAVMAGGLMATLRVGESIRESSFTAISIITTTGFSSADFGAWRPALQILVIGLMFVGGMAGSTAGSIKTFRLGILTKSAYNDLRRLVHPRAVFAPRFGSKRLSDPVIESVQSFFLFYIMIFMVATFLLAFIDANLMEEFDLVTTTSAVAASLGNIGPGLGEVGPSGSYTALPALSKWLLAGLMVVGRLELFPVLVLFTRDLWKR
jgi:trk system potassium uptake protein